MAIYLKYGTKIKGNVTADKYTDWIELSSVNYSMARPMDMTAGASGNRGRGNIMINPVSATKSSDKASALIMEACFAGEGETAEIALVKQGKEGAEEYLKITMDNCIIDNFGISGAGGEGYEDMPQEQLGFNYTKIKFEFKEHDDKGAVSGNQVAGWDLTANKKV